MHKVFKQFKNWDLTTMGYYSYLDFQNLEFVKKQFNNVSEKSDYSRENKIDANRIFKYWEQDSNTSWKDYRVNTYLANKTDNGRRDEPALYVTQTETRNMHTRDVILYLEFPLKHIRDDVKNTMYGEFDYDVLDEFMKRWDESNCDYDTWVELHNEFNNRYPKIKDSEYVWCKRSELDLHGSFKNYGQLNIPVIDRPYDIWWGSSHTFFHACYLKWDTLKVFIKVPVDNRNKKVLKESWYSLVPPNNFSHGHYDDSKIFYIYYFDLKNEKIYYKKYPAKKYRPMRDALNRVPSDFYKTEEFEELKL